MSSLKEDQIKKSEARLAIDLNLGEGPLWHADDGCWWFLDITDKKLCRVPGSELDDWSASELQVKIWDMLEEVSVIRKRRNGKGLVCASRSGFAFINSDYKLEYIEHAFPEDERHLYMFNDGACDAKGRFFAGSKFSQDNQKGPDDPVGILWRLDTDHSLHKISEGHTIPNGIGWSPDNKTMYFTDSQRGTIWQYDYDLETAEMSNKRAFVRLTEEEGEPDGLCVDVEGGVWSARFNGAKVVRYSPTGEVLFEMNFPKALNVTCPAFGGKNMDELLVTTASVKMTPDKMSKDHPWDHSGHVYRYKLPLQGLPVHEFGG